MAYNGFNKKRNDMETRMREILKDVKSDRLTENEAVMELCILFTVTQRSEPLINSDFLKYIASNRPLLLFELTNEVETYQELINGG